MIQRRISLALQGLLAVLGFGALAPATLAVAWAAQGPFAVSPIISASNPEQLNPSLAAIEITLSSDLYNELSALAPSPPPATDRIEEKA